MRSMRSLACYETFAQWALTSDMLQLIVISWISSMKLDWKGRYPYNMKYRIIPKLNVSIR